MLKECSPCEMSITTTGVGWRVLMQCGVPSLYWKTPTGSGLSVGRGPKAAGPVAQYAINPRIWSTTLSMQRWLTWTPASMLTSASLELSPPEPPKPSFGGFGGASPAISRIVSDAEPAVQPLPTASEVEPQGCAGRTQPRAMSGDTSQRALALDPLWGHPCNCGSRDWRRVESNSKLECLMCGQLVRSMYLAGGGDK